ILDAGQVLDDTGFVRHALLQTRDVLGMGSGDGRERQQCRGERCREGPPVPRWTPDNHHLTPSRRPSYENGPGATSAVGRGSAGAQSIPSGISNWSKTSFTSSRSTARSCFASVFACSSVPSSSSL